MNLQMIILMFMIVEIDIPQLLASTSKNYYNVLGLREDADEKQIKKAYRELAKIYHPDRNSEKNAEEKFRQIVQAYEVLSDPEKKQNYDKYGDENHHHIKESPINFDDFLSAFNKHFQFSSQNSHHKFFSSDSGKYFTLDEMFTPDYVEMQANGQFHHRSNSGRCKTVTQRFGNMVTTYTQCA